MLVVIVTPISHCGTAVPTLLELDQRAEQRAVVRHLGWRHLGGHDSDVSAQRIPHGCFCVAQV